MSIIDKAKIKPVPIQKTLTLINNFVANTSIFFNDFTENVEKKISNLSAQITDMEVLLAVLEAKLNSVPELQDIQAPKPAAPAASTSSSQSASASTPAAASSAAPAPPPPSGAPPPPAGAAPAAADAPPPPADAPAAPPAGSSVPEEYKVYEKMLKVGVPLFVVQAKATTNGHDPAIVEKISMSL